MYFCEDHFDLPNDMENYIKYRVQGSVKKIRMKKGCLPSRFDCQPDRKRTAPSTTRSVIIKKQRKELVQKALEEYEARIETSEASDTARRTDSLQDKEVLQVQINPVNMPAETERYQDNKPIVQDKSVQVYMHHKYRSKGTQTKNILSSIATSPLKKFTANVSVSPFKTELSRSGNTKVKRRLCLEDEQTSESGVSLYTPSVKQESSPSVKSLEIMPVLDSSTNEDISKIESEFFKQESLQNTLNKIKRKPRYYIGVPKTCYYLVNIIEKEHNIPEKHILLCLKKIRLDTKFCELGDEFGMSLTNVSKIFFKNVPIIAKALQQFIVKLDENTHKAIKLNLPIAFSHKYYNVLSIIDCLEIAIQKPSKALNQALAWSEYKKANTIKYLISCTPDGIVNYNSPGYGGRISDVLLVEHCNFLDSLKPGTCILADRGFKHLNQLLLQKGLQLLRPPSVPSGEKLSKQEVRQTKQIASIRIYVERVIRRVREFSMFKPHSVININILRIVDEA